MVVTLRSSKKRNHIKVEVEEEKKERDNNNIDSARNNHIKKEILENLKNDNEILDIENLYEPKQKNKIEVKKNVRKNKITENKMKIKNEPLKIIKKELEEETRRNGKRKLNTIKNEMNYQENMEEKKPIKKIKNIKEEKIENMKMNIKPSSNNVVNKEKNKEKVRIITKKIIKKANMKSGPLSYWKQTFKEIKDYRSTHQAPVDTEGCERLAKTTLPPPQFRYQVLISLMLSAQTKDPVTAEAMRNLQAKDLSIPHILEMPEEEINECIKKVGFHNRKTIYIKQTTKILHEKYNDDIPDNIEELIKLPGVGKKMGYLTLQNAWDKNDGIGVDVHVHRISERLGWIPKCKTPEEARLQLENWLPSNHWKEINPLFVGFGQICCTPVAPKCSQCPLSHCPSRKAKKNT